jgi:hypothetical protein
MINAGYLTHSPVVQGMTLTEVAEDGMQYTKRTSQASGKPAGLQNQGCSDRPDSREPNDFRSRLAFVLWRRQYAGGQMIKIVVSVSEPGNPVDWEQRMKTVMFRWVGLSLLLVWYAPNKAMRIPQPQTRLFRKMSSPPPPKQRASHAITACHVSRHQGAQTKIGDAPAAGGRR